MVFIVIMAGMFPSACSGVSEQDPVLITPDGAFITSTPFQPGADAAPVISGTKTPIPTTTPLRNIILEKSQYPTTTAAAEIVESGVPFLQPQSVNPLTGLLVADAALLDRRPIAIKITNYPRYVRPQFGLSRSDVVFEYYIEDQLTRFIAVFYGQSPEQVGPVRSGRFFDEHIARMYHAFLVFKYADERVFTHLKESDISDFLVVPSNGACPPFLVGKDAVDTYNNIFFNTTRLNTCVQNKEIDNSRQKIKSGFFYNWEVPSTLSGEVVYTSYSVDDYNYWEYDPDSKRYYRYQEVDDTRNGKPETYALLNDRLTGEPVTAENVIVLFVSHNFANQWDQEDEVYHIDLLNSGNAIVFRDGLAVRGKWYRSDIDQPLLITDLYGLAVPLRPGRTFYQIIGISSVFWQDGKEWRFVFSTP